MRLFIIALLAAISYAQTGNCGDCTACKSGNTCNWMWSEGNCPSGWTDCYSNKVNLWSDKDCREIRRKDDCFAYYSKCEKACDPDGDFDLAQARLDAGVNDANVASGQCAIQDEFVDSRGFDCTAYEGARWCEVDGAGTTVEGPGWCNRWPRSDYTPVKNNHCRVMPGRNRMNSFGHYANENGIDARKCCCNMGAMLPYSYDLGWAEVGGGSCNDRKFDDGSELAWHDLNGWTCRAYYFGNLCDMNGQREAGWNNADWGTFEEHAFGGMHAKTACCACGGGMSAPEYDDLPGHLLRRMDKFIDKGYSEQGLQNWNRIKKHARAIIRKDKSYDPAKLIRVENIFQITKLSVDQSVWDAMMVEWNALKALHPDFGWMR